MPIRVLLVEDNPGDVRLVREGLAVVDTGSFDLTDVDCLEQATKRLRAEAFDVVVLDLSLPDSQGLDTLANVWKAAPDVPILVLTGTEDERLGLKLVQAGAQDYWVKGQSEGFLLARAVRYAIERKRTAEEYRAILHTSLDGFCIVDERQRFVEVNNAFCRLLGYSRDELLAMTLADVEADESPEQSSQHAEAIKTSGGDRFQTRHKCKDGALVDLEISVTPIGAAQTRFVAFLHDITKRKQAEEALRQSAEQWQATFDAVSDGIWLVDAHQRIVRCNKASADLVGRPVSEIEGRPCWEVAHGTTQPIPECPFTRMRRTLRHEEAEFKQGGRNLFVSVDPILDPDGRLQGAVHVLRDMTERRRLEKQFVHAQKMESIGRLAGGVAHDFNNMLCVILGQTELAMEQVGPDAPLYNDLREIQTAGQRSAALTNQLLAFARRQAVEPRVLDLNESVEATLKMLRRLIGEQIELIWLRSASLWPVKLDPGQLDQVLANLTVNARDAIGGSGSITIKTENVVIGGAELAAHEGRRPGDYVVLSVGDTGCGMSQEVLDHMFEPFFTTKKPGEGTGLGLATVYGIVRQNAGFIDVTSTLGKGTTFKIHFPRYEGGRDTAAPDEQAIFRSKGETVLLVEDEVAVMNLTRRSLENVGYTVLAATRPSEALRQAEAHGAEIDLLVTDIAMPEMTGPELARRLKARLPGLKQLFVSGYDSDRYDPHRSAAEEGLPLLRKPFSPKALAAKVRQVLDG